MRVNVKFHLKQVLLVADDAEIRRLITSSNIVKEKLGIVSRVNSMSALVQNFKVGILEI